MMRWRSVGGHSQTATRERSREWQESTVLHRTALYCDLQYCNKVLCAFHNCSTRNPPNAHDQDSASPSPVLTCTLGHAPVLPPPQLRPGPPERTELCGLAHSPHKHRTV